MRILYEGEKRYLGHEITRQTGSGAIVLTSPERRILDSAKVLVTGFDWAAATWDSNANKLYALFDTTATGLTAIGRYYLQFRATIDGVERYIRPIEVVVRDVGP